MKRLWSLLLSVAFFPFGVLAPIQAADFADTPGTAVSEAVQYLQEKGIVQGFSDGTYRPEQTISRAEFLKIALTSANFVDENCAELPQPLSDVSKADWFFAVVCSAMHQGVVNGYPDGTFRPQQSINFAEASKIIAGVKKLETLEGEQSSGEEWFQSYVRSLQDERVVPESIERNDHSLTRGEMAEIIFGLDTGKEIVPANGSNLRELDSCTALSRQLEKFQRRQQFFPMLTGVDMPVDDAEAEVTAPQAAENLEGSKDSTGSAGGERDYSQTNLQEAGVDEGDIIKNDGEHIYLFRNNTVRILKAVPAQGLEQIASIDLGKDSFWPQEMYVSGKTLTVIGNESRGYAGVEGDLVRSSEKISFPAGNANLQIISFDLSDPKAPKQIRKVGMPGFYINSRRIGDTVYVVANNQLWNRPLPLNADKDLGAFSDSAHDQDVLLTDCADVRYFPNFRDANLLVVAAIPTVDTSAEVGRTVLLGSGSQIYASAENLYVTRPDTQEIFVRTGPNVGWDWRETTDIFKFALENNSVRLVANGEAEGQVYNQFFMSEHDGDFRIATQKGNAWGGNSISTSVTVFDSNLKKTGEINGIAPGEGIKAVRFIGDRAYVVTFKNVDPLFVLDLSAQNPKILGELKIPGWTDYLHPYDETHLIGIGTEVNSEAENKERVTQEDILGLKLSLFDVSDLTAPKELFKKVVGARGSTTEATYNHKAFLFDKARGILALPVTTTEVTDAKTGAVKVDFSGAQVYDVDLQNGFTLRGEATNFGPEWFEKAQEWFAGDFERMIQRILYIGETFYTVAPNMVQALEWDDLKVIKTLTLDTKQCTEIWNEFDCSANTSCRTVWQENNICTQSGDDEKECTTEKYFLRCEAK